MTDSDIVAELRERYEDALNRRHSIREGAKKLERVGLLAVDVLPQLLDAIDTLRWYADEDNYHDPTDVPDHLYRDSGDVLLIRGGGGQRARTALAALKRSDEG